MLAEETQCGREPDLSLVAFELNEQAALAILDAELDAVWSLDDLTRAVAGRHDRTARKQLVPRDGARDELWATV